MYCNRCGHQNQPGAFYCTNCNAPLEETSPSFDSSVPPQNEIPNYTPYPNCPYSYNPYPKKPGDPSKNWAAITSLVCGILAFIFCYFSYFDFILAIPAIVFGAIGLKSTKRGLSIAGFVCGIVGTVISMFFLFLFLL